MRWYLNDASLQAQFAEPSACIAVLRDLLALRQEFELLRSTLYVSRTLSERQVRNGLSLVQLLRQPEHREVQALVLRWLGRAGPFLDDDRWPEADDYFEYEDQDVSNTGLGEATRRIKAGDQAETFSFLGGALNFALSPLTVWHGLPEDRLGQYEVPNLWSIAALRAAVDGATLPPSNWRELVETARVRFPRLWLPDAIYLNDSLSREAFDSVICGKALTLLGHLDRYMGARRSDGSEEPAARKIIQDHFTGDRSVFSGESPTNQKKFKEQLSFPDPDAPGGKLFAHWHGKISHRFFRLHFEWPVPPAADHLKVVYLGPKITKG
jgi:hypothetical protein